MHQMRGVTTIDTPFQRAGQIYDRRVGQVARTTFFLGLCLALSLLCNGALVYGLIGEAKKAHVEPIFVEVDPEGNSRLVHTRLLRQEPTTAMLGGLVRRYVTELRARPADMLVLQRRLEWIYGVSTDKQKHSLMAEHQKNDPRQEAATHYVDIRILRAIEASHVKDKTSWDITWRETTLDAKHGGETEVKEYSGLVTLLAYKPQNLREAEHNSLGYLIDHFSWSGK